MVQLIRTRENFVTDDFAVVKFLHDRKIQFPNLFHVAARIYATAVSSSSSERVFSFLILIVDDTRSRLSDPLIDDIIVIRPLHKSS